jgi:hypothetical protein
VSWVVTVVVVVEVDEDGALLPPPTVSAVAVPGATHASEVTAMTMAKIIERIDRTS